MKLFARFRKAAALPFVLLLVALNVTVVVALLIYATTELRASRNSGQTEVARALAQSGIDLAAALISANSTNNGFVSYQRVTNFDGTWRLETKIGNVAPDSSKPWKTTIKNPVILHSGFASGTSGVDLNFSVAGDPSAGFIAPRTNILTPGTNVSAWTNLSTNMFRMDWIYVYKGDTNDPRNLVGRIAYWVDDESSKLNVNYSGITNFYSTNNNYIWGAGYSQFTIAHAGLPSQGNMAGEKWPIQMEFGGIGGISSTNAYYIIASRGIPKSGSFKPYPSVLGTRLGTIGKPGGLAITNLSQQAALGFSATVYSKEDERSYSTGQKRYDLLNINSSAPAASTISEVQGVITGNPALASFASKYDLPSFAAALYSRVQIPGLPGSNAPATNFGASKLYNRGLPLLNEVSVKAVITNSGGSSSGSLVTDIGVIVLSKSDPNATAQYTWATSISRAQAYTAEISYSPAVMFGLPVTNQSIPASSNSWFKTNTNPGPTNNTFYGSIKLLSRTNAIAPGTNTQSWSFPTNITIALKYNEARYQTIDIPVPTNAPFVLGANQTNTFHLVSQPRGDGEYRGDPRFGVLKSYVQISAHTNDSTLKPSLGTLNTNSVNSVDPPNWKVDGFPSAANTPDLVASSLYFGPDRGIPQYTADKAQGFGSALAGVGWLGEVPVTTASAPFLAWSTPRLWGDGRTVVNGTSYPPDWLLLDLFHMAAYPAEPATAPVNQQTFSSYGRVNVNSAKPFFQIARSSKTQSDTIIDSVIVKAETIDFREYHNNGAPDFDPVPNLVTKSIPFGTDNANNSTNTWRTLLLSQMQQMTSDRNSTNTPYTTHFEFLADLAATNLPNDPSWWVAPNTNTGSIYTATNTTDRRIEGIVRSLVQKFTTHGNQFSIFSLAQALQVTPSGKTNVVGEAYLQAVYERAPRHNESTGAITNSPTGAPPMRQLYLRELRY